MIEGHRSRAVAGAIALTLWCAVAAGEEPPGPATTGRISPSRPGGGGGPDPGQMGGGCFDQQPVVIRRRQRRAVGQRGTAASAILRIRSTLWRARIESKLMP